MRVRLCTASDEKAGSSSLSSIEAQKDRALEELRIVEREMLVLRAEGLSATIPLEQIERGLTTHVRQVESMPQSASFMSGISKMELRVLVIEDQAFQQEALKSLLQAASKLAVRACPLCATPPPLARHPDRR